MNQLVKSIFLISLFFWLTPSYSSMYRDEIEKKNTLLDVFHGGESFNNTKNSLTCFLKEAEPCFSTREQTEQVDLVIFSFDRPLQVYGLLESIVLHMKGIQSVYLIYRTSDERYENAYQEVQSTFPYVNFLKQEGSSDFKALTLHALHSSAAPYTLFAVDDNIVKDKVDLNECVEWMEKTQAYGFYLKLGSHLNFCYTLNRPQRNPLSTHVSKEIYSWEFDKSEFDWNYPNTLDMTLYRKTDLLPLFESLDYTNPNWLEYRWASWWIHHPHSTRYGLFYQNSKILNIPLNRVQNDMRNRTMNLYSQEELLQKFEEGLKIDVSDLYQIKNPSVHFEYEPKFISRALQSTDLLDN